MKFQLTESQKKQIKKINQLESYINNVERSIKQLKSALNESVERVRGSRFKFNTNDIEFTFSPIDFLDGYRGVQGFSYQFNPTEYSYACTLKDVYLGSVDGFRNIQSGKTCTNSVQLTASFTCKCNIDVDIDSLGDDDYKPTCHIESISSVTDFTAKEVLYSRDAEKELDTDELDAIKFAIQDELTNPNSQIYANYKNLLEDYIQHFQIYNVRNELITLDKAGKLKPQATKFEGKPYNFLVAGKPYCLLATGEDAKDYDYTIRPKDNSFFLYLNDFVLGHVQSKQGDDLATIKVNLSCKCYMLENGTSGSVSTISSPKQVQVLPTNLGNNTLDARQLDSIKTMVQNELANPDSSLTFVAKYAIKAYLRNNDVFDSVMYDLESYDNNSNFDY